MRNTNRTKRSGFTLVELVVVILVLGIIAAVAAPKMFDTAGDARDNTTITSLEVLRDAIELYKAETGAYPGEVDVADLKADLTDYVNGAFPKSQVPGAAGDASVSLKTAGTALVKDDLTNWMYDNVSGELIINETGYETY